MLAHDRAPSPAPTTRRALRRACGVSEADPGIVYQLVATRRSLFLCIAFSNHSGEELFDRREKLALVFNHDCLRQRRGGPLDFQA
jgi:hypothetical protein